MNRIEKTENIISAIAGAIDEFLKETDGPKGFAIILFDFYKPGVSNYLSNAKREDIIKALRETADRIEKNETIPPTIGEA